MGAPFLLVRAFIREATETDSYAPEADVSTVYAKIRAIQRGHFTTATGSDGLVQVSSSIGGNSFSFVLPERLDRAQIIEVAEAALGMIEGLSSVAEIRARCLARRKTTRADFSSLEIT